jgi:hypothetical protein
VNIRLRPGDHFVGRVRQVVATKTSTTIGTTSVIAAPPSGHPVPPPARCTAADLAQVSARVAAATSVYLCNHPDVSSSGGPFPGCHRSSPRAGAWRRTRSLALGALSGHRTGVSTPTRPPRRMGQWAGDRSGKSRLKGARSLWLLSRRSAAPVGVSLTTPGTCHTAGIEPGTATSTSSTTGTTSAVAARPVQVRKFDNRRSQCWRTQTSGRRAPPFKI